MLTKEFKSRKTLAEETCSPSRGLDGAPWTMAARLFQRTFCVLSYKSSLWWRYAICGHTRAEWVLLQILPRVFEFEPWMKQHCYHQLLFAIKTPNKWSSENVVVQLHRGSGFLAVCVLLVLLFRKRKTWVIVVASLWAATFHRVFSACNHN